MKQCVDCGVQLEDDAKFCSECGSRQPELKSFCTQCGAEMLPGAKFCIECGASLDGTPNQNASSQTDEVPRLATTIGDDVEIELPDDDTIGLTIKGIRLNMKFVEGQKYTYPEEIADFYIGETLVTQALWMTVMGSNPSQDNEELEAPVTNLDRQSITAFLLKLNKLTGIKFTIPTNRQLVFAEKGGVKSKGYEYPGSNNINEVGWTDGKLHPVAQLYPNELGLYDLCGLPLSVDLETYENKDKELYDTDSLRLAIDLDSPDTLPVSVDNILVAALLLHSDDIKNKRADIARRKEEKKQQILAKCQNDVERKYVDLKYNYGLHLYSSSEKPGQYLRMIFGTEYVKYLEEEQAIKERVEKALKSSEIEWEDYGFYKRGSKDFKLAIIDEGRTLVIKGEGEMPLCAPNTKIHWDYENDRHRIKNLIFMGRVTKVQFSKDVSLHSLKHIILPESVTEIGKGTFRFNTFHYIKFPSGLRKIGEEAFQSSGLKTVFIPNSVTEIGKMAFEENTPLRTVIIPARFKDEIKSIFSDCKSLKQ